MIYKPRRNPFQVKTLDYRRVDTISIVKALDYIRVDTISNNLQ
jgi:hypothetical protein